LQKEQEDLTAGKDADEEAALGIGPMSPYIEPLSAYIGSMMPLRLGKKSAWDL
jgi:hypothetical protein